MREIQEKVHNKKILYRTLHPHGFAGARNAINKMDFNLYIIFIGPW